MTLLDTSALIGALSGERRRLGQLRGLTAAGERVNVATLVLYEWRRGPRTAAELEAQRALLPEERALAFTAADAARAARPGDGSGDRGGGERAGGGAVDAAPGGFWGYSGAAAPCRLVIRSGGR